MVTTNYTDVSICNLALDTIGESNIETLEDEGDVAAACSRIYPAVRDMLIVSHDWKFARRKKNLSVSGDETPINEWARAFMLPPDMLAGPFAVFGDGSPSPTFDYEIYGNYLYADYQTVIIDDKWAPPVENWPAHFRQLCAKAVAAELCIPLTDNTERASELRIEVYGHAQLDGNGGLYARAKRIDSQASPTRSIFANGDMLTSMRY